MKRILFILSMMATFSVQGCLEKCFPCYKKPSFVPSNNIPLPPPPPPPPDSPIDQRMDGAPSTSETLLPKLTRVQINNNILMLLESLNTLPVQSQSVEDLARSFAFTMRCMQTSNIIDRFALTSLNYYCNGKLSKLSDLAKKRLEMHGLYDKKKDAIPLMARAILKSQGFLFKQKALRAEKKLPNIYIFRFGNITRDDYKY